MSLSKEETEVLKRIAANQVQSVWEMPKPLLDSLRIKHILCFNDDADSLGFGMIFKETTIKRATNAHGFKIDDE